MVYRLLRPLLFVLPPETAHALTLSSWQLLLRIPGMRPLIHGLCRVRSPQLQLERCGLVFPNRIGLAAGLDKDGRYLQALASLGFGFVEIGTVTPLPQPGNEAPRLFRLPADRALLNRMGFNNQGADVVAARLKEFQEWKVRYKWQTVVGVNIGKNRSTPLDEAVEDYLFCFDRLHQWADYIVINVSSPNTEGLRELQQRSWLDGLLGHLQQVNEKLPKPVPLFLKIAPDLSSSEVADVVDCALSHRLSGLIAANTTVNRHGLRTSAPVLERMGSGGISGKPLAGRSTELIRIIRQRCGNRLTLMASGGIFTPEDVREKLQAGADLIQLYTALVYEGPGLVRKLVKALARDPAS
ncbi:MAG: quinone-dependent dihydroorotate dehydrogenase [Chitinophagales bacterium]|nr:quinone-dependent dihydroorotate dehydrogenase [Chitinophagales bacterium]MDW8394407.1 quinone-dependent dihydroorotate dehydrogenase [Chitinophagales bacterium]